MRILKTTFLLFCYILSSATGLKASSPISAGVWVKMRIPEAGVYKLSFDDLKNAGFNVSSLDPRLLQLRGHQGGMLPAQNNLHTAGLPEIPMMVIGESDGKFDGADYILFYAGCGDKWLYNQSDKAFTHSRNIYSNESFLYLGIGVSQGLRIQPQAEVTQAAQQVTNRYTHTFFHDSDIVNPIAMGSLFLGEKLGNETLKRNFSFSFPANTSDSVYSKMVYAGSMMDGNGMLRINLNGVKTDSPLSKIGDKELFLYTTASHKQWVEAPGKVVNLELELVRPNTSSAAWLDYIEFNVQRDIDASQKPLLLRHAYYVQSKVTETRLLGSGNMVWNVSNEMNPSAMAVKTGGSYEYFRSEVQPESAAFVAFKESACLKPAFMGAVGNADVLAGEAAELIIITHPDFMAEANDLAQYRRTHDGYKVKVVVPQAIFNEYSVSQQDVVAIRDYLRDEYNKSLGAGTKLKYVLLLGSTSYDPKNRVAKNTNFVPVYQHYSVSRKDAYCLDDFLAYLDPAQGDPDSGANTMFFSVGRIPARTPGEAAGVIAKLKRYDSPLSLGPWRSELSFVCDDVDKNYETAFVVESEKYAGLIDNSHPDLVVNKIYVDAYKQQSTGNTEQYPDVSNSINRVMNNGALFLNYQGHGGERGWAQEAILTIPMINAWKNPYSMPILFTATCEFGRYDDPAFQSGGERALLNADGGAVALLTTTRLVWVQLNSAINFDFWSKYGFPSASEPIPTIGDIYQRFKNRPGFNSEDRMFALLGDPSMRLAFPEHDVVLDSINGTYVNGFSDTLKAFSIVKMKGHIAKRTGGLFSDFNGTLWVKVFDKGQVKYTLDNDNHNTKLPFKDQTSFIFKGVVSVVDGKFQIIFSVPKDIAYNVDFGKITMYAHNGVTDASGARNILIGGSSDKIDPDDAGPAVKLFMNDTTFVNNGAVEKDAIFITRVFDESGINATGAGIGRDMIAVLDEGTENEREFILNDYFIYDLNSYTKGTVKFELKDLAVGSHTIWFKVWDIHNNSSEATLQFEVLDKNAFVVNSNVPRPNPFQKEVILGFTHNLAGHDIRARVSIFDLSGRQIMYFEQDLPQAGYNEDRLIWDGKTSGFSDVGNGMYLYRVDLTSDDGRRTSFNGRIMRN